MNYRIFTFGIIQENDYNSYVKEVGTFIILTLFMKIIITALAFLISHHLTAQNLHLTLMAGVSNYQGDLQSKRFTFNQAQPAFGIGAMYELSDKLYIRAAASFAKVSGDDKKSPLNKDRNLSFSSPITEAQLGLEYDILNLYERSFTPYLFAGVAAFRYNPSAIDSAGNKVYLRPLSTEGQGFYLNRKLNSNKQIAIPFGGGIKLALSEDIRLKFEIGMRYLFTDYLDDVSTTYPDEALLLANKGPQAVALSFRAYENKPVLTYPTGGKRGNPSVKDLYYFTGLTISFRLSPGQGNGGGNKKKSQYGCPVMVY